MASERTSTGRETPSEDFPSLLEKAVGSQLISSSERAFFLRTYQEAQQGYEDAERRYAQNHPWRSRLERLLPEQVLQKRLPWILPGEARQVESARFLTMRIRDGLRDLCLAWEEYIALQPHKRYIEQTHLKLKSHRLFHPHPNEACIALLQDRKNCITGAILAEKTRQDRVVVRFPGTSGS